MLFKGNEESDHLELRQIKTTSQILQTVGVGSGKTNSFFPVSCLRVFLSKELDHVRPEAHASPSATKKVCSDQKFLHVQLKSSGMIPRATITSLPGAFQRLTQLAIGNHVGCGVFP